MVEHDFEALLRLRPVPVPRSNLAERIIAAAPPRLQKEIRGFSAWLEGFLEGFALPQPALAMAVVLVLGVFAGFSADGNAEDMPADDLAGYLYLDNPLNDRETR